jgi:hypothetical protein
MLQDLYPVDLQCDFPAGSFGQSKAFPWETPARGTAGTDIL